MSGEKEVSIIIRAKDATVAGLKGVTASFTSWANSLSGQMTQALAFDRLLGGALDALGALFRRAKDETIGAERAATQLSNTMRNAGVSFAKAKPDIDAAVKSLQKVANVDDDDAIAGLNRMVQLTGNYRASLSNLGLVADVAAAKQISFGDAANLVGKVMAGTGAKALKDFGITAKDAGVAIEELRRRVAGSAATEKGTLEGSLKAADLAFGDFAQSMGEAVSHSPAFREMLRGATQEIRDLTTAVGEKSGGGVNKALAFLGSAALEGYAAVNALAQSVKFLKVLLMTPVGKGWVDTVTKAYHDMGAAVTETNERVLNSILKMRGFGGERGQSGGGTGGGGGGGGGFGSGSAEELKGKANALRQLIETYDKAKEKANANGDAGLLALGDRGRNIGKAASDADLAALQPDMRAIDATARGMKATTFAGPGPDLSFGQRLGVAVGAGVSDADLAAAKMESLGKVIADLTAGPITAFGDAIGNAFDAMVTGSTSVGKAFLQSIGGAVRGVAALKGKLFAGEALAALGEGFLGNPAAFLAAAKYGLAAAAMFALAGAAGGIGQGGGGGGASTPAAATASSQQQLAGVGQGNLTVYIKGKKVVFDASDPDDQDGFVAMIKKIAGNRQVDFVVDPNG